VGSGEADGTSNADTDGTAQEAVASMKLEPTSCNVPAYDDLVLETVSVQQDKAKTLDSDAATFAVETIAFKWRGFAAKTMQSAGDGAGLTRNNASP